MATKISKTSYTHSLRFPTIIYKWVVSQRLNPSETFSGTVLRLLWEMKTASEAKK